MISRIMGKKEDNSINIEEWLSNLGSKSEELSNLSKDLRYMLNNVHEFERGEIELKDFENHDEVESLIIRYGVFLGCYSVMENYLVYEVFQDGESIGFSDSFEEAKNIGADYASVEEVCVDMNNKRPRDLLDDIKTKNPPLSLILEKSYSFVNKNENKDYTTEVKNGAATVFDDNGNEVASVTTKEEFLAVYSIQFGELFEIKYPSTYTVYDDSGVHEVSIIGDDTIVLSEEEKIMFTREDVPKHVDVVRE